MGLGYILLALGLPGDASLLAAERGGCASLRPEIPSGLLFRLCSLSEPTGVLVAGLSSWTPRDDLDLSSPGPSALAPFRSSHKLSKRTGSAFSRGSSSSL
ncbi:MAG: hypothetical protein ACK55Z_20055 [bacterium]